MVLNKGKAGGKQILSEKAVKEMTTKQTGSLPNNYGLGWSTGGSVGHGGAFSTNMSIDPKRGLITVWMVQHAGYPEGGNKSHGAFVTAAFARFKK
jgi:CubicO group peptidase (beta-lactamase class C family)